QPTSGLVLRDKSGSPIAVFKQTGDGDAILQGQTTMRQTFSGAGPITFGSGADKTLSIEQNKTTFYKNIIADEAQLQFKYGGNMQGIIISGPGQFAMGRVGESVQSFKDGKLTTAIKGNPTAVFEENKTAFKTDVSMEG